MVSFDSFKPTDGAGPIYVQIVRHIKSEIAAGRTENGDELPSRRVLSALLGINPNTIQKAYRILEDEGIINSHAGAKSYVTVSPELMEALKAELAESELLSSVTALKKVGLTKAEAMELFEKLWERR